MEWLGPLARSHRTEYEELISQVADDAADQEEALISLYAMVRRRAAAAGVIAKIGNHSFRGTGITTFLLNDGTLELAQELANHSSPPTTNFTTGGGIGCAWSCLAVTCGW